MIMKEKIQLTKLAPNCGCAAKVGPGTLAGVLGGLPKFCDPDLLVGTDTSDDAAVYRVSDDLALIQTLDFFTPVADDPYDFGQIAAANALSDVYAMGGTPKTALNIVAFPKDMDVEILGEILRGGADKVMEAGAVLAGGHAIQDAINYAPLNIRSAIVPAANIGSQLSWPLFIAGLIFSIDPLVTLGIVLFSLAVLFQLVTLPVEINASSRALKMLESTGILGADEKKGARKVLTAAALTYVAALAASILQLLRLIILAGGRDRD